MKHKKSLIFVVPALFLLSGCNVATSKIAGDLSSPCNKLGDYFQSFRYGSGDNYKDRNLIQEDLNSCIRRLNMNMDQLNMSGRFTEVSVTN